MSRVVQMGSVAVGEGMPKICVPAMPADSREMYADAERIVRSPADIIELRADHIRNYKDEANISAVLKAVRDSVPNRPVLFTLRTADEGGRASVNRSEYVQICRSAIDSGMADAVDIELLWGAETAEELVSYARERGVVSVVSMHDFDKTPEASLIVELMNMMQSTGADIIKMAAMPSDNADMAEIYSASHVLKNTLQVPFILIAMSVAGAATRIGAEQIGSAVTFASAGSASAPGQIDADDLDRMLRILHSGSQQAEGHHPEKRKPAENSSIALIGFMGSGKSTVASEIGRRSGMEIREIDDMIAEAAGMKIPEIFRKHGEEHFRNLEEKICESASSGNPAVISCGGGTVLRSANVEALRKGSVLIMLDASPDLVFERVRRSAGDRPLLADHMSRGYISWLMKQRDSAYRSAADIVLDINGKTSAEIAVEILEMMKNNFF